jgi:hypothetical protein
MYQATSRSYYERAPASGMTIKPRSPVCPDCHSSLNRVPRRFIDRLVSLVYPVRRYHCRSFDCDWEGNLRYSAELRRWEALDAHPDNGFSSRGARAEAPMPPGAATVDEQRRRESDTLPMPSSRTLETNNPNARAEPRDGTNPPRRARKRAKAAPR